MTNIVSPNLIGYRNGVLNLDTMQLEESTSGGDRPIVSFDGDYVPDAEAPFWEATLNSIVGSDQQSDFAAAMAGLVMGDPARWDLFEAQWVGDKTDLLWLKDITLEIVSEKVK